MWPLWRTDGCSGCLWGHISSCSSGWGLELFLVESHSLCFASPALPNTCLQAPAAHPSFPSPSCGRKLTHSWLCASPTGDRKQGCCFLSAHVPLLGIRGTVLLRDVWVGSWLLLGAGERSSASCWQSSGRQISARLLVDSPLDCTWSLTCYFGFSSYPCSSVQEKVEWNLGFDLSRGHCWRGSYISQANIPTGTWRSTGKGMYRFVQSFSWVQSTLFFKKFIALNTDLL